MKVFQTRRTQRMEARFQKVGLIVPLEVLSVYPGRFVPGQNCDKFWPIGPLVWRRRMPPKLPGLQSVHKFVWNPMVQNLTLLRRHHFLEGIGDLKIWKREYSIEVP